MSNKKHTSVSWLVEGLHLAYQIENDTIREHSIKQLVERTNEIHKQEIIDAVEYGCSDWVSCKDAEQYYRDNF